MRATSTTTMKELVLAVRALTAQLERLTAGGPVPSAPSNAETPTPKPSVAAETAEPEKATPPVKQKYTFDQIKNTLLDCSARFGVDVARELLAKVGCDRVKSLSESDYPVLMNHIEEYLTKYTAANPDLPQVGKDE